MGKIYGIRAEIPEEVRRINGPFLFLANHVGTYEPFLYYYFLQKPIHFVASDAVMQDRFMRWLLKGFGVIQKKKNRRDSKVIREMLQLSRAGHSVGLFPEGNRTWTGNTLYFEPSIAKLIKRMNVPVITARSKGMLLFNPRWAGRLRKTRVLLEYRLLFDREGIKASGEEEIYKKISEALAHDEWEWQSRMRNRIKSRHRAEYLESFLFLCPHCEKTGTLHSRGNDLHCSHCRLHIHVDAYGFFHFSAESKRCFANPRDCFAWQMEAYEKQLEQALSEKPQEPIFIDHSMNFFEFSADEVKKYGPSKVHTYIDRIEVQPLSGATRVFRFDRIDAISTELHERLELHSGGKSFRLIGAKPGVSSLKYEITANIIWKKQGSEHKLSAYLKSFSQNGQQPAKEGRPPSGA
jgi:1-acyl-sn-glycerol-3-phosphate acyltransferase